MARLMVVLSLLVNVAVLLPVCVGLLTNASWTTSAYGEGTPARAILLSIYLAIGIVSVLLLVHREPKAVADLPPFNEANSRATILIGCRIGGQLKSCVPFSMMVAARGPAKPSPRRDF